jgi:hypothetical protein
MSIAITEAIVDGVPWTPVALAAKFVEVFNRDLAPATPLGFTSS